MGEQLWQRRRAHVSPIITAPFARSKQRGKLRCLWGPSFAPVEPESAGRAGLPEWRYGYDGSRHLLLILPTNSPTALPNVKAPARYFSYFAPFFRFLLCSVWRKAAFAWVGPPLPSRRHARRRPYLGACLFASLGIASEGVREGGGGARFIGATRPNDCAASASVRWRNGSFSPVLSCSFFFNILSLFLLALPTCLLPQAWSAFFFVGIPRFVRSAGCPQPPPFHLRRPRRGSV